jgi:hypothetical protein
MDVPTIQEHPYQPGSTLRGTDESENRQEKAAGQTAKVYFAKRYWRMMRRPVKPDEGAPSTTRFV